MQGLTISTIAPSSPHLANTDEICDPEAITIRMNGIPYTYHTSVSNSNQLPALKPLATTSKASAPSVPKGLKVVSISDGRLDVQWNKNPETDLNTIAWLTSLLVDPTSLCLPVVQATV